MGIKIKDIPINDRPRERLINGGVDILSDEELLAVIIKTGTRELSAKDLSGLILSKVKGINNLNEYNLEKLKSIKGIGEAKACLILACIELSKRMNREVLNINNTKFTNCEIVYNYYKNIIGDKKQEYFYCIYLDNNKKIIKDKLLYIGTINYSIVHPREVFKEAYMLSASAIICVHNHPSGNVLPSKQDLELTKNLISIGNLLGIKVIDHIIIGNNNYYSFLENNDI